MRYVAVAGMKLTLLYRWGEVGVLLSCPRYATTMP
jgi:hypothetical protein